MPEHVAWNRKPSSSEGVTVAEFKHRIRVMADEHNGLYFGLACVDHEVHECGAADAWDWDSASFVEGFVGTEREIELFAFDVDVLGVDESGVEWQIAESSSPEGGA